MRDPFAKPRTAGSTAFATAVRIVCWIAAGLPGPLAAEIVVDGRLVETKADGVCSGLLNLTAKQRYVDCLNGTVWDTATGLIWLQRANCASLGPNGNGSGTWTEAMEAVAAIAHGLDCDGDGTPELTDRSQPGDWRLASRWEWHETSLEAVQLGCSFEGLWGGPALTNDRGDHCWGRGTGPSSLVGVVQSREYWTSSTEPSNPFLADAWWLADASPSLYVKGTGPPAPLIWPVRGEPAYDGEAPVQVDGAPVETAAEGPCFDLLGLGEERYVDCGDGTVLDTLTDLLWLRDATCSSLPGGGAGDYLDSINAIMDLADGTCGLTDGSQPGDWRLASRDEWRDTGERAAELGCTVAGAKDPPALTDTTGTECLADGPTPFVGIPDPALGPIRFWTSTISEDLPDQVIAYTLTDATTTPHLKGQSNQLWSWPVRPRGSR